MLGHFHPVVNHFPIVLWLLCAAVVVLPGWRSRETVVRVLLLLAVVSTVFAVATGLLFANEQGFQGRGLVLINRHRNLTLIAGSVSSVGAVLWWMKGTRQWLKVTGSTLVVLGTLCMCVGAHMGGLSVYGEDFFSFVFSNPPVEEEVEPVVASAAREVDFEREVRPILRKSCYRCHGRKKQKGELRLDVRNLAMEGGEDGPVIVPGHSADSELYRRISLPTGDEDYMPSKGTPLTPRQVDTLKRWIDAGAPWPDTVTPTPTDPK